MPLMADIEGSAREPLATAEEARATAKCSRCRLLGAVVGLLVVAAGAGVGIYFATRPLECAIDLCSQVILPDGARSCTEARCGSCPEKYTASVDSKGGFCGLTCGLPHCAERVVAVRGADNCDDATAKLSCGECEQGWEFELDRKTLEPTGNCSFSCSAAQEQAGCAPRTCSEDGSCTRCRPGFRHAALQGAAAASCTKETAAASMNFYMYRAQSDVSYPPENCDLASAAGVMWYLHNEVVILCPRHYDITRILRYNVTVFNPAPVFALRGGQFGHFVQFDYGQCTVPDCKANWWDKYGYMVGCQQQDSTMWKYDESYWYSLPGKCPSQKWNDKTAECIAEEAGGNCSSPDGSSTCTWHVEPAGEVSVDDLSGIKNLAAFCAAGNVEYDPDKDRGRGCSFWDDKFNKTRNQDRVMAMQRLFAKNYPTEDALAVPAPMCDGF